MRFGRKVTNGAARAARYLFKSAFYSPHWCIGWRLVDDGEDVWARGDLGGRKWQTLRNEPFRFFADPFPVIWENKTWVFFEDFDHRLNKGQISGIAFGPSGPIGEVCPVLSPPWHLSFPYVFEHQNALWMVPESSQARTISLYRADQFPQKWVKEADLLVDIEANDTVVVPFGDRLWMFTTVGSEGEGGSGALHVFHSKSLFGPWLQHRGNPVLLDRRTARSAGPAVVRNGVLWRVVQDCEKRYGAALGLAEVVRLDETSFKQELRTVIRPDRHWPGWRLHTLSRAGRLECIDGSAIALRRDLALRSKG
jgi:hypothetical protein